MSPIITNNINFSKPLLARACSSCLSPLAQACSSCPPRKLALFLKTTLPPSDSSDLSNLSDLSNSSNPSDFPSDSPRFSKSLPPPFLSLHFTKISCPCGSHPHYCPCGSHNSPSQIGKFTNYYYICPRKLKIRKNYEMGRKTSK